MRPSAKWDRKEPLFGQPYRAMKEDKDDNSAKKDVSSTNGNSYFSHRDLFSAVSVICF